MTVPFYLPMGGTHKWYFSTCLARSNVKAQVTCRPEQVGLGGQCFWSEQGSEWQGPNLQSP